ncbi:MAG: hypothetical protein QOJ69_634 [Actinomycetota bacterium]|nr:hypothetical protein [Actinomycetota bacterium]
MRLATRTTRTGNASAPPPPPEVDREWVSFESETEHRTWIFDVTFLLSRWTCIFRNGCQGVLTEPTPERELGCCSYGAHFTDEADVDRVAAAAETLSAEEWQFRKEGRQRGISRVNIRGETVTRQVQDACVFLNRPDFPTGAGCALHQAAVARGQHPLVLKPNVCWQLPLRQEDTDDGDGHVTSRVVEWGRAGWGAGGAAFHWWCTESPEAFVGAVPVYRAMAEELAAMVGDDTYRRVADYLDRRVTGVALLHPAVR